MSCRAFGEEHFSENFSVRGMMQQQHKTNTHTKIVEIARGSTERKSAADADPESSKSKGHSGPPYANKSLRYVEQETVEDQKCRFDTPQHHEDEQRDHESQLQVLAIEGIRKRRSFLLVGRDFRDPS